jgi:hypothetical protein
MPLLMRSGRTDMRDAGWPFIRSLVWFSPWALTVFLTVGLLGSGAFVWAAIIVRTHELIQQYWFYVAMNLWIMTLVILGGLCVVMALEGRVDYHIQRIHGEENHVPTSELIDAQKTIAVIASATDEYHKVVRSVLTTPPVAESSDSTPKESK